MEIPEITLAHGKGDDVCGAVNTTVIGIDLPHLLITGKQDAQLRLTGA